MKKISFLLVSLLTLFACEQEEMGVFVKSDVEQVQTRAASSIADFNAISELDGIPVNVLNVGNTSDKYLSAKESVNPVVLYTHDDGSLRQRWNISGGNLILIGGSTAVSNPPFTPIVRPNNDKTEPILAGGIGNYIPASFSFIPSGIYYKLQNADFALPPSADLYLQASGRTGSALKYGTTSSTDLALWKIVPVGEYRLVDVQYEKSIEAGDFINQKDQFVKGAIIPVRPEAVEHTITVSEKVTESSTFTETNGVTTQNQSSFNWGLQAGKAPLPVINLGGSLSSTTTSSHTVGYTDAGSYEISVSQSFKITVPANKSYTIEVLKMSYNTSLTYVATLEKRDGVELGERFRIKGKWDGILTTYLYYHVYETGTGNLVETKVLEE